MLLEYRCRMLGVGPVHPDLGTVNAGQRTSYPEASKGYVLYDVSLYSGLDQRMTEGLGPNVGRGGENSHMVIQSHRPAPFRISPPTATQSNKETQTLRRS